MKKTNYAILIVILLIGIMASSFYTKSIRKPEKVKGNDTLLKYVDGTYDGTSRDSYTDEPYWGRVRITIRNGSFSGISFEIRDSNLHERFDGAYEKHFAGNPVYIDQSRNDWHGVQYYPPKLMETQDVRKVDALTGATWSYNIFRASVEEALKGAAKTQK